MPARFVAVGEPAHDTERQALRFLVQGLPEGYTVYGNPWLVEASGVLYEVDAVVAAPHAFFVVEIKSYRGMIEGTDHDWYVPHRVASPLKLNRKTAQVLHGQLARESYQAGQTWTQDLVFLSASTGVGVRGPASRDRLHTRKTILAALQDPALVQRLSGRPPVPVSAAAARDLERLLTGVPRGSRPVRRIREYEVVEKLEHEETYTELLGRNTISGDQRVLRIYALPPLASDEQRQRVERRARWESQVLGRIGRSPGILDADPPFADEAGIVVPFEHFPGITLGSWVETYGPRSRAARADLKARTDLWIRIARALLDAHEQGVVHRLLRPEVVLVDNVVEPGGIRVTGFDLAKQVGAETTISLSGIGDERLSFAAPEVVGSFSAAEPRSDQFSLGALLALLLIGRPLFESTRALLQSRVLLAKVRDADHRIPLSLDEAVARMLETKPTARFPGLEEAIEAVRRGRDPEARAAPSLFPDPRKPLDPDDLEPGTRVGPDYEIVARLGQGGMATVYAARHLVSGRTRALKIARPEPAAEKALRGEHAVLADLDHPNVVKVIDITKMIEGRLTLVMERVGGESLRQLLAREPALDPPTRRKLAEDLLNGLDHLEQKGVIHKDLKPDNLLVGDQALTIIDFSLARDPEDAAYGGTALYRDPASARWSHGSDRYAAALCLFELYAGRHAFDGRVPEPGAAPALSRDDIEPAGLAEFFLKALDPVPEKRFPSVQALRDAFRMALGETVAAPGPVAEQGEVDGTTPLRATALPRRAVNALGRSRIHTVGELLGLRPAEVRAIHAIGSKTAGDIVAFQETLRARGLGPAAGPVKVEPVLLEDLVDSPEPVDSLALPSPLRSSLRKGGLPTVGAVARLTRARLLDLEGVGRKSVSQVIEALHRFRDRAPEGAGVHTLDGLWELACRPLNERQRLALERVVGVLDEPERQEEVAEAMGVSQPQVSVLAGQGLERLDLAALAELSPALEGLLDSVGGVASLLELGERLEQHWAPGMARGTGMIRLLARLSGGRLHLVEPEHGPRWIVARPLFDRAALRGFVAEAERLAGHWPPLEPDAVRLSLAALVPGWGGDAIDLAARLSSDIEVASTGHLFIGPLEPRHSLAFVLDRARDRLALAELQGLVRRTFGARTPFPDPDHLVEVLHDLGCQVVGEEVIPGHRRSVLAPAPIQADPLTGLLAPDLRPEEVVRNMLRNAERSRGFRMLVTPPETHAEIARSVAAALRGTWVSLEEALFAGREGDIALLEGAERYSAQRALLTEAVEEVLEGLLGEHGRPGHTVVVGDTAVLGVCEALDLPRRLYDETLGGDRGFWVLVIPGVIHKRQPLFNEGPAIWHLEGATLPLAAPLPA